MQNKRALARAKAVLEGDPVPRDNFPPFTTKIDERYAPGTGSSYTLVLQWADGSDKQPLLINIGSDTTRVGILTAMEKSVQQELAKAVLEL